MFKLLMLDLDGTTRESLSGERFVQHPRDQRIIKGAEFRKSGAGILKLVMWQFDAQLQVCSYIGDRQEDATAADAET